jgi:uncharacterized protein (TIGR02265 family)
MEHVEAVQGLGTERSLGTSRWVVFEHTVEGLFRGVLRERLSALGRRELREAGVDLSRPLLPAYDYPTWRRCLEIAAADVYPTRSRPEAWRQLGRDVVNGMVGTVLGRAMVSVARLLGPLRSLRRLNTTLRSADNYVEARLTELSPTCCEVWINEVMDQPTYYQGVLEASVALTGARDIQVRVLDREGRGARLRVEWGA